MAGHDYLTQFDLSGNSQPSGGWDYTLNYDGTRDPLGRAVRGAVDEFFSDSTGFLGGCPIQVTITYYEPKWNTWAVRKPFYSGSDSGSYNISSATSSDGSSRGARIPKKHGKVTGPSSGRLRAGGLQILKPVAGSNTEETA